MPKKNELIVVEPTKLDLLTKEEAPLVSKDILNVREEVQDCPYLGEALKVLPVRGYEYPYKPAREAHIVAAPGDGARMVHRHHCV